MSQYIYGPFGVIYENYPNVVRETDKYVDYAVPPILSSTWDKTREHKFMCVGGPFHQEYWTRTQLIYACPGYKEFNNAGGSNHRVIFAWTEE